MFDRTSNLSSQLNPKKPPPSGNMPLICLQKYFSQYSQESTKVFIYEHDICHKNEIICKWLKYYGRSRTPTFWAWGTNISCDANNICCNVNNICWNANNICRQYKNICWDANNICRGTLLTFTNWRCRPPARNLPWIWTDFHFNRISNMSPHLSLIRTFSQNWHWDILNCRLALTSFKFNWIQIWSLAFIQDLQ